MTNAIAGHGQSSHPVPTSPGLVVEMRDGNHNGTSIWLREDGTYAFASHDHGTVRTTERAILLVGHDIEQIAGDDAWGCDLEGPGLVLIGCAADDDLEWLSDGAEVLWDSAGVTSEVK